MRCVQWGFNLGATLVLIQAGCVRSAAEIGGAPAPPTPSPESDVPVVPVAPPTPAPATPSTPTAGQADPLLVSEQLYRGWKYFEVYCARCHGDDARGSFDTPDLTYSLSAEGGVTTDSFATMVRGGATSGKMKGFEDLLDQPLVEAIYAYLKRRSDGQLPSGRPHRAPTGQ